MSINHCIPFWGEDKYALDRVCCPHIGGILSENWDALDTDQDTRTQRVVLKGCAEPKGWHRALNSKTLIESA